MTSRRTLSDGAPDGGFPDESLYATFDRDLLPLAIAADETTATQFIDTVHDRFEVHPWTVSRWLWSAHERQLIEPVGSHRVAFECSTTTLPHAWASSRLTSAIGCRFEADGATLDMAANDAAVRRLVPVEVRPWYDPATVSGIPWGPGYRAP